MSNIPNPYQTPSFSDSPLQGSSQPQLAGLGKRLLGAIVDGLAGLVAVGPGYAIVIAGVASNPQSNEPPALSLIGIGIALLGGVALLVTQIYLLATRSQTVGKFLVKTQIWDVQTGQPATFVKTFVLRLLVNGVIGAIPCIGAIYSIADILFIFREDRRCIHDLIANTVVLDIENR